MLWINGFYIFFLFCFQLLCVCVCWDQSENVITKFGEREKERERKFKTNMSFAQLIEPLRQKVRAKKNFTVILLFPDSLISRAFAWTHLHLLVMCTSMLHLPLFQKFKPNKQNKKFALCLLSRDTKPVKIKFNAVP